MGNQGMGICCDGKQNMKKLSVDELTRLAFVWAEQDRSSLAQCWPKGSLERQEAAEEANQLRQYRLKRWGRTLGDAALESVKSMPILKLKGLAK